jgi:hypothetical protein
MLPIRTILQPTDFSAPAEDAFELACFLARDYGALPARVACQAAGYDARRPIPAAPA